MLAIETKRHAPALTDPHRPVTFQILLEGVQSPAGEIHVLRTARRVNPGKLKPQPSLELVEIVAPALHHALAFGEIACPVVSGADGVAPPRRLRKTIYVSYGLRLVPHCCGLAFGHMAFVSPNPSATVPLIGTWFYFALPRTLIGWGKYFAGTPWRWMAMNRRNVHEPGGGSWCVYMASTWDRE